MPEIPLPTWALFPQRSIIRFSELVQRVIVACSAGHVCYAFLVDLHIHRQSRSVSYQYPTSTASARCMHTGRPRCSLQDEMAGQNRTDLVNIAPASPFTLSLPPCYYLFTTLFTPLLPPFPPCTLLLPFYHPSTIPLLSLLFLL